MRKKHSNLLFIDELNYSQLQSKSINLESIHCFLKSIQSYSYDLTEVKKKISSLTFGQIELFNRILNKCLFDYSFDIKTYKGTDIFLSHQDVDYIKHYVKSYLIDTNDASCEVAVSETVSDVNLEVQKYYEIISLPDTSNNDLLIVFKERFFENLTKSKDELLKFILDCLGYQYRSDSNTEELLKLYLSVKNVDGYFDLIKLRSE